MSAYDKFVRDFPDRAEELFVGFEFGAKRMELEVTFMLSMATAGLIFPLERLRPPRPKSTPHPSRDWERYAMAVQQYKDLCQVKFTASAFGVGQSTWCFGALQTTEGGPDNWLELQKPKPIEKKTAGSVLGHLRNALAHGNVYTEVTHRNDAKLIKNIVFLAERSMNSGKFNYLLVKPNDFSRFLRNWFSFIKSLNFTEEPAPGCVDDYSEEDLAIHN